jgi:cystathionine gamma-synthase
MKIETLAVHAGSAIDPATGAVSAPIYLSTTFERDIEGTYSRGFMYTRNNNPNRQALEEGISALEGGAAAAAFASGTGATGAIFQALAPGDHVLAHLDAYYGTSRLLREIFLRWGLEADFIDMSDLAAVKKAMRQKTKLAWMETPSNPLLKIVDLAEVSKIVHEAGALCVCDNTWAPILQRPFDVGADFILHSTTKYFGGHCDVLGGIVIAKFDSDLFQRVRNIQYEGGAVPSPFDCWLILRGMRTLPWRMRAHSENAMKVAEFLAQHPKVEVVHYPGLHTHPGHEIAGRQMSMFGGMLSFEVKEGRDAAMSAAAKTKIFTRATSLGGVESLIEHRASVEGPGTTSPEGLLRLSIGLENADDLIEDLDQAVGWAAAAPTASITADFLICAVQERPLRALRPPATRTRRRKTWSHQAQSQRAVRITLRKSAIAPTRRATSDLPPSRPAPAARPRRKSFPGRLRAGAFQACVCGAASAHKAKQS